VHLTGLDFVLWALTVLEDFVLLAVLWRCKRAVQFPVFTALIAFDVVRSIALYLTFRFGTQLSYFYAFWTLAFVDITLQLGIVYEVAGHVFRPLGAWAQDVRRSFLILSGASVLVASALTWLAAPPTPLLRKAIVIRGNFFSSALMGELFVTMVALAVTIGLPWRTQVARLAQGLGVYSIFGVVTEAAHTYIGTNGTAYMLVSHIRISLYCICMAYWIVAMALPEPVPRRLPEDLRVELRALQGRAATLLQGFRELGHS
jgi:hypothetical protein